MEAQRPPAQWYALLVGVFLVALGVLSLVTNGLSFSSASHPSEFVIWKVNGWDTILWMAMGALGILASARLEAARSYGMFAAIVFAVLAVWGFIDSGYSTMGIFALGTAGNITHAVLAVVGAMAAMAPETVQRSVAARRADQPHAG